MLRFVAVPPWQLEEKPPKDAPPPEELRPAIGPEHAGFTDVAFTGVEYRGYKASERARALIDAAGAKPAVFARPPNDLPALLRTADELLLAMRRASGERAQVWHCGCGARYAVPLSLSRPVALRCDRCGRTLELEATRGAAEAGAVSPEVQQVNAVRGALADFFREAMARGWVVLVSRAD